MLIKVKYIWLTLVQWRRNNHLHTKRTCIPINSEHFKDWKFLLLRLEHSMRKVSRPCMAADMLASCVARSSAAMVYWQCRINILLASVSKDFQFLFWVWVQPITKDVTMHRRLSFAERLPRGIIGLPLHVHCMCLFPHTDYQQTEIARASVHAVSSWFKTGPQWRKTADRFELKSL